MSSVKWGQFCLDLDDVIRLFSDIEIMQPILSIMWNWCNPCYRDCSICITKIDETNGRYNRECISGWRLKTMFISVFSMFYLLPWQWNGGLNSYIVIRLTKYWCGILWWGNKQGHPDNRLLFTIVCVSVMYCFVTRMKSNGTRLPCNPTNSEWMLFMDFNLHENKVFLLSFLKRMSPPTYIRKNICLI